MRFKCLVLDHDDTAVNSSKELHYPAYREIMPKLRPEAELLSFDAFMSKSFAPGFSEYLRAEFGFSDDEIETEYRMWAEFIGERRVSFFQGFPELIKAYQSAGGITAVVSYSMSDVIAKDYKGQGINIGEIFGNELEASKNKPNAYPIEFLMRKHGLRADEILVLDDLGFGEAMARNAGAGFAYAAWSHGNIKEINDYMRANADFYCESVADLSRIIMG